MKTQNIVCIMLEWVLTEVCLAVGFLLSGQNSVFCNVQQTKISICLQKCEEIHYFLNKKLFGIELKNMGLFPHFKDSGVRVTLQPRYLVSYKDRFSIPLGHSFSISMQGSKNFSHLLFGIKHAFKHSLHCSQNPP